MDIQNQQSEGYKYAILAYGAWGFFPIYWKLLASTHSLVILAHRLFWTWVFYTGYRFFKEKKLQLGVLKNKTELKAILLSASLITCNWLLYIWGVNSGHIVETSLGYFMNPLVNVLLGVFLLKEKLSSPQKTALIFATIGVLYLTYNMGFARKQMPLSGLHGGQAESLLMMGPLLALVFMLGEQPLQLNLREWGLLVLSGVVTGLPLIWFVEAGQRMPYSTLGFFQYLAPTLQFLCGVFLFGEVMNLSKLMGFLLIWFGLIWLLYKTYSQAKN
jgi:chloramphenicol-sensitive protein RarD